MLKKVLSSQFGAIKPPWIDKEMFYKLPFNFCDRWCERCRLAKICRVYQKDQQRKEEFIARGIDPYCTEAMLKSVEKDFRELKKLLEKEMRRLKITKKDLEEAAKEDDDNYEKTVKDPLNQISLRITKKLSLTIEDLRFYFLDDIPPYVESNLEILGYYLHFIPAKVHRALSSYFEDEDEDYQSNDSKNSTFLAYIAVLKIVGALENISKSEKIQTKLKRKIRSLIKVFNAFSEVLKERFNIKININIKELY